MRGDFRIDRDEYLPAQQGHGRDQEE